jgi:hypothetical protein
MEFLLSSLSWRSLQLCVNQKAGFSKPQLASVLAEAAVHRSIVISNDKRFPALGLRYRFSGIFYRLAESLYIGLWSNRQEDGRVKVTVES